MRRLLSAWAIVLVALWLVGENATVSAQTAAAQADGAVSSWIRRTHEASRQRTYVGTFVVSSGGAIASAKIWHACDGAQQMERVEVLSGTPRSTFRHNSQVITFLPAEKVAVLEERSSLGLLPGLWSAGGTEIDAYYILKPLGSARVAGLEAEVIALVPKDGWRYGYRIWSEKKTGLVVQVQTMDLDGQVLDQAAFSELQLDAPVSMGQLSTLMHNTQGYQVVRSGVQAVDASALEWSMRPPVSGFKAMGCYKRPGLLPNGASGHVESTVQWVFSDGLATVSLFAESYEPSRHVHEGAVKRVGATHTLSRHVKGWWITAVGEVPPSTLNYFVNGLERNK